MTLKERYLMLFHRSQVVGYSLYWKDRRITHHITVPKGNMITHRDARVFILNKDKFYLRNGIPHFTYNADDPEPIFPSDHAVSAMPSVDLNVALHSNIAKEILESGNDDNSMLMIIGGIVGVSIVVMLGGFYMMNQQISALSEVIKNYEAVIEALRQKLVSGGL